MYGYYSGVVSNQDPVMVIHLDICKVLKRFKCNFIKIMIPLCTCRNIITHLGIIVCAIHCKFYLCQKHMQVYSFYGLLDKKLKTNHKNIRTTLLISSYHEKMSVCMYFCHILFRTRFLEKESRKIGKDMIIKKFLFPTSYSYLAKTTQVFDKILGVKANS